jgi:hypothetical protein
MSLHVGAQRLSFAAVISLEASDACVACRVGERSVDRSRQNKASMSVDALGHSPHNHVASHGSSAISHEIVSPRQKKTFAEELCIGHKPETPPLAGPMRRCATAPR